MHYLRLPAAGENGGALSFFSSDGMAFWLIAPIFITMIGVWIYALVKKREGNLTLLIMLPLLAVAHLLIICCHKTLGGWQFGNRYLLDMMPYLFFGLVLWKPKGEKFVQWNTVILVFGFAINLIGTVATYNHWI